MHPAVAHLALAAVKSHGAGLAGHLHELAQLVWEITRKTHFGSFLKQSACGAVKSHVPGDVETDEHEQEV